jgi:hypothetical protein
LRQEHYAGGIPAHAESPCQSDCGQTTSQSAATPEIPSVDPGEYDLYDTGLPLLFIAPSNFAGNRGLLSFLLNDNWTEIPLRNFGPGNDNNVVSVLKHIFDPPVTSVPSDAPPADPTPTPEPPHAALFAVGIAWAAMALFKLVRPRPDFSVS